MASVSTEKVLSDIPVQSIEYVTVVYALQTFVHTPCCTTRITKKGTHIAASQLDAVMRLRGSSAIEKRDGVWCSVDRPVGCLALMVVVSE